MAHRCPDCGHMNDDSRLFCEACGEPLDANVRLAQSLKREAKKASENAHMSGAGTAGTTTSTARRNSSNNDDDDDYEYVPRSRTKKKSSGGAAALVLVGLLVVVIAVCFFLAK